MGDPLSVVEISRMINQHRNFVLREIHSGRLQARCIFNGSVLVDSDDFEMYVKEYRNNKWMNEGEIARYLGLRPLAVRLGMHGYEMAGEPVRPQSSPRPTRIYNIDSPVMRHIFKLKGWDKYAEPNGHKDGRIFASEDERRIYARSAGLRRSRS